MFTGARRSKLGEEPNELGALIRRERREGLVLHLVELGIDPLERAAPAPRSSDDIAPSIGAIRLAPGADTEAGRWHV